METITHSITYRKLTMDEKIEHEDMHSMDNGRKLYPIHNLESTLGTTPAIYHKERTWWRPIESKVVGVKE